MKKEHKFLIYSLILSALCGSIALIVDQIAIQQESSIRNSQIEADEMEKNSLMMRSVGETFAFFQTNVESYMQSVSNRFFIMTTPELEDLSFLYRSIDKYQISPEDAFGKLEDSKIIEIDELSSSFSDNPAFLKEDYSRYLY